jgi:hypothetical protein
MTGKLLRLKSWVTLKDAASHLSLVLEETVNESDLIQLALEQELTLSVILPEPVLAVLYEKNDTRDVDFSLQPIANDSPEKILSLVRNSRHRIWRYVTDDWDFYHPNFDFVCQVRGLNDLLITETSSWMLSQILQTSLSKAPLTDPRWPSGPLMIFESASNMPFGLVELTPEVDYEELSPADRAIPVDELPESASLVVSRDTLAQFTASLLGNEANTDQDTPLNNDHQDYPPHLEALILAWRKRWKNADRHDRSTHPKKDTVKSWLIEQGLSDRTADAGATIITPDWKK